MTLLHQQNEAILLLHYHEIIEFSLQSFFRYFLFLLLFAAAFFFSSFRMCFYYAEGGGGRDRAKGGSDEELRERKIFEFKNLFSPLHVSSHTHTHTTQNLN